MRYPFILFVSLLAGGCGHREPADTVATSAAQLPTNIKAQLRPRTARWVPNPWQARYDPGTAQSAPRTPHSKNRFVILADTNSTAHNFISFWERNLRRCAAQADTIHVIRDEAWQKLTAQQKQTQAAHKQATCGQQADSTHIANNRGHFQIWLLNNSADTVHLARQDGVLICVLQARGKDQRWHSMQYWQFSMCGNSYYDQLLLPGERFALLGKLPKRGPDKIKLRYKLAGTGRFYYSNEFESRVDYHDFVENNPCYKRAVNGDSTADDLLGSLSRGSKSYWMTTTLSQLLRD